MPIMGVPSRSKICPPTPSQLQPTSGWKELASYSGDPSWISKVVPLSRSAVGMGVSVGIGVSVGMGVSVGSGVGEIVGVQVGGRIPRGVGVGVLVKTRAGKVVGGRGLIMVCGLR